jgi:hypothetical protein
MKESFWILSTLGQIKETGFRTERGSGAVRDICQEF